MGGKNPKKDKRPTQNRYRPLTKREMKVNISLARTTCNALGETAMKNTDWRAMNNGRPIPTEAGYCDQPSVVRASDGTWVCTVTTGKGAEGAKGQYVSITRSADQGRTWTEPVSLEETDWESAYSSLALAPSGRIYCFYCYNLDRVDIERVPLVRYDMGGYYCYRYSEDNGVTWSDRHIVPVRDFETDEKQAIRTYNGKPLRFFWNVSRVFFEGDDCYSALIKYTYRPVKEIVERVGYLDARSFIRKFKSSEGLTPGQYRSMAQGNRATGEQEDDYEHEDEADS